MRSSTLNFFSTRYLVTAVGLLLAAVASLVLLLAPYPVNVGIIPGIVFGVILVFVPWAGPLILAASVPVQEFHSLPFGGLTLTATKVALVASAAAFIIQLVSRRDKLRGSILFIPYLVFIGAMLLSLRGAVDIHDGIAEIYRWTVTLFALALALYGIRSRAAILATAFAMGFGVIFEGLLGVFQTLRDQGPASFAITSSISRAYGTFGKPNTFAAYFELTGPLLAALAVWSLARSITLFRQYRIARLDGMNASAKLRRELTLSIVLCVWFAGSSVLSLLAIVASFSRGAWLGITAAAIVMVMLSDRRAALVVGCVSVLVILGLAAGGGQYAPPAIKDRFGQLASQVRIFNSNDVLLTNANFAAVERMAHWQTGIAMFDAYPFTGVGIGNFNARFAQFAVNPSFTVSEGHAHNYYINAAAETGGVGLAAYLWFILTGLWISLRPVFKSTSPFARAVGIGAVGVTVALMVHNVVDDLHVLNLGVQLSVVWALAIIVDRYLPSEAEVT
ncbi:MAG TPA: O-antigen ligase family protein [Nitrolancea sp.]|nr:O-antigen ligase family protein [Nitrolancea sp.]